MLGEECVGMKRKQLWPKTLKFQAGPKSLTTERNMCLTRPVAKLSDSDDLESGLAKFLALCVNCNTVTSTGLELEKTP